MEAVCSSDTHLTTWKVKAELPLSTSCRHLELLEVYLYSFITMALDGVSGEHHVPVVLPPEMYSCALWIGGWVVPEPVLKFWKEKNLLSLPGLGGRLTWPSWKIAVKLGVGKSMCHDGKKEQKGCHWKTKQWIVRWVKERDRSRSDWSPSTESPNTQEHNKFYKRSNQSPLRRS